MQLPYMFQVIDVSSSKSKQKSVILNKPAPNVEQGGQYL